MEHIIQFINIFLHLDKYLSEIIQNYGYVTYIILFIIIFCETGLVILPFYRATHCYLLQVLLRQKGI